MSIELTTEQLDLFIKAPAGFMIGLMDEDGMPRQLAKGEVSWDDVGTSLVK